MDPSPLPEGQDPEAANIVGWDNLTDAQRADIRAHIAGLTDDAESYAGPAHGWTCFHCGETFKTLSGARLHFGKTPTSLPVCSAAAVKDAIRENVKLEWVGGCGTPKDLAFTERSLDRTARVILDRSETAQATFTSLQAQLARAREVVEPFARLILDADPEDPIPAKGVVHLLIMGDGELGDMPIERFHELAEVFTSLSEEGEEGSSRSQPCADAQERSPEAPHSGGGGE